MKFSEHLIHILILMGILILIYLIICKLLKPLGVLPKALAEALEQLLIMVFEMIAKLVHYIVVFIKSTVPVIFEHLLKLVITLFLFVIRGFTWLINGIVSLLNRLFRLTQN
ncbi:MAG: hypothetical protein E2590_04990 [Chryseobacterium sp.]|nr:hypothetical protein [Chryseobacterium sp.]